MANGIRRAFQTDALTIDEDLPGRLGLEPEEGPRQLRLACPHQAEDAEDLAGVQLERSLAKRAGHGQLAQFEDLPGLRTAAPRVLLRQLAADHHLDQVILGGGFDRQGGDSLPVPQDSHSLSDQRHLG